MSVFLLTGLPGNAKSLFAIDELKRIAERDKRPVFYSGIPLTDEGKSVLNWVEIDPEKWFEAPPNAIVVIDECQRIFRPRSMGKEPPPYVSQLETHRHGGIDLWLITQHPMLVDSAVRRLTQHHTHMMRVFGMKASNVHKWNTGVVENCDKPAARKSSMKSKYIFNKKLYPLYKSAEVHTVKRHIPKRVVFIAMVPVAIAVGVGYMYHFTEKRIHPTKDLLGNPINGAGPSISPQAAGASRPSYRNAVDDAKQYVYERTARIDGLAYTAPKYDDLTKPTAVPVPAACVHMGSRCSCYTQQATPLDVTYNQCLDIAHHGYFQDFDANANRERVERSRAVLDRPDGLPLSHAQTRDVPPNVAATGASFGSDGFAIRQPEGVRQPGA